MTRRVVYLGYELTVAQWAAAMDLPRTCLLMRLRRGMPVEVALTLPTLGRAEAGRRGARRSRWSLPT